MAENESILENKLIHELATGDSQWTYRPDLKTEDDLWNNIREKLGNMNSHKLDGHPITDSEMEHKFFIVVKDTGIGIPKEDQDRIFERFFCVDRSHSNKDSTGLGLTIVKHIVEECHGTIDVDSKLGEGTTFTLAFEMA